MNVGNVGHFFVIISFVSSILAGIGYFFNTQQLIGPSKDQANWRTFSRIAFGIHAIAVLGIVISLYYIIRNHRYEYHYAWDHSSNILPVYYMISCFWEGQEGSFLLWIFWHALLGLFIIRYAKNWEAPVMSIFSAVQAFLCSMILGVLFTDTFKIGSSPFVLLKDVLGDLPIYKMNPNYVPSDGTGLNPLLQNYWMVIHPPTLFLGFALTLVPFSFCISGLYTFKTKEWVKPALPWALIAALVLGIGIMMGAYWAYETLNFGGYWNWDPVENAVYVPWIMLVAAIHTMIIYKSSETALRLSSILVVLSFILVLYSTFLTRSGILGEASVHSFTDLGLSGQLLLYLSFFLVVSAVIIAVRWKSIPATKSELEIYDKEFWLFIGVAVLTLMLLQVLVDTSRPVYNAVAKGLGFVGNAAPPSDAVGYYGLRQMIFSILVLIVSATAQFFYWNKVEKTNLMKVFYYPLLATGLLIIIVLPIISSFHKFEPLYLTLVLACLYAIVSNAFVLSRFMSKSFKFTGGSVSHIGIALMLLGILYSAGFSKVVSLNTTGMLISKQMSDQMNQENSILYRNTPTRMADYTLTFKGPRIEIKGLPGYFSKEKIQPLKANKAILLDDAKVDNKVFFKKGDTVTYFAENTYFQIDYSDTTKARKHLFSLYPRIQSNDNMGNIASPDIRRDLGKDLYTHITYADDGSEAKKWSDMEEQQVSVGDTLFLNDYVAKLNGIQKLNVSEIHGILLTANDIAVQADLEILGADKVYHVHPTYIIKDMQVGRVPEVIVDLGLRVVFMAIDPASGKFTFGIQSTQKDFIVMKAAEKPMINLLWIGTGLVCAGLLVALIRRWKEARIKETL